MPEEESLKKQLELARRRLAFLEEQYSGYGKLNVPAHIPIQIEDTRNEVADLEKRLSTPKVPPASRAPETPVIIPPTAPTYSTPAPVRPGTPAPKPIEPEQTTLLRELENPLTTHYRRRAIGERLNTIGDTRPGVGVQENGTPDIAWLPVSPSGEITISTWRDIPGGLVETVNETFPVQSFYISQYLTTYAQYEAFVKAKDGYNNPEWWHGMTKDYQPQNLSKEYIKPQNNARNIISWYQSVAFARWLNQRLRGWQFPSLENGGETSLIVGHNAQVRLPLESEWQWAAQGGSQQRKFPWGEWQEGYANTEEAGLGQAIAVGMYPQGAAASGAMDMEGQLWEWCLNDLGQIKSVALGNDKFKSWKGNAFNKNHKVPDSFYSSNPVPAHRPSDAYNYVGRLPLLSRLLLLSAHRPSDAYYHVGVRLVVASPIAQL